MAEPSTQVARADALEQVSLTLDRKLRFCLLQGCNLMAEDPASKFRAVLGERVTAPPAFKDLAGVWKQGSESGGNAGQADTVV